ncbi:MAG: hypothetical protein IJL56_00465 [Bacteroidales bacterium]|nr:hypothetical protein [Bacteroidales bacterium]
MKGSNTGIKMKNKQSTKKSHRSFRELSIAEKVIAILWILGMCYIFVWAPIEKHYIIDKSFKEDPKVRVTAIIKNKYSRSSPNIVNYHFICDYYYNGNHYTKAVSMNNNKSLWEKAQIGDCVELLFIERRPNYLKINKEKGTFKCHQMPYSHEYVEGE